MTNDDYKVKIGTLIQTGDIEYRINDIIIFPPQIATLFFEDYIKSRDYSIAVSRFISRNDLEVFYCCDNLNTNKESILYLIDLKITLAICYKSYNFPHQKHKK